MHFLDSGAEKRLVLPADELDFMIGGVGLGRTDREPTAGYVAAHSKGKEGDHRVIERRRLELRLQRLHTALVGERDGGGPIEEKERVLPILNADGWDDAALAILGSLLLRTKDSIPKTATKEHSYADTVLKGLGRVMSGHRVAPNSHIICIQVGGALSATKPWHRDDAVAQPLTSPSLTVADMDTLLEDNQAIIGNLGSPQVTET